MKNKTLFMFLLLFGILACNDDDDSTGSCNMTTVISSQQYANEPSGELTINHLEINGDCLKINFSSNGCNGDTWVVKLIDSEEILESNPAQRELRLSLKNDEDCGVSITKELTFDISNLQLEGNQVVLNILNPNHRILYEY
ncbi:hypothetical protein [Flavobacterium sp.]|uniref:hypothetical protein n=1 Tax=Flavobacterium sp. TaxID=239 RepID=UPI004047B271